MNTFPGLKRLFFLLPVIALFLTPAHGVGANVKVRCGEPHQTINGALKSLDPSALNTVTVSGDCNENVVIQGFDRLTLITTTNATINIVPGGVGAAVNIVDSRRVTLQGFTINGGVFCDNASVCYMTGNTLQASLLNGITVSDFSKAFLTNNVLQNNAFAGMTVNVGSEASSTGDTYTGNADAGIRANQGYVIAISATVQNNGSDGNAGIFAVNHATLRLISCTITGNINDGVNLQAGSEALFDPQMGPNVVTGNGVSGVRIGDLSFARFSPTNNITGNLGGTDVVCSPQFSATRGALTQIGGGTTNCLH